MRKFLIINIILFFIVIAGAFRILAIFSEQERLEVGSVKGETKILKENSLLSDIKFLNLKKETVLQYTDQQKIKFVGAIPERITNIKIKNPHTGGVLNLYWTKASADNINIYRSESPTDGGNLITTLPGSATYYQDSGLDQNKKYYYTIVGVNKEGILGEGAPSESSEPRDTTPPAPPLNIEVLNLPDKSGIKISFTPPTDEDFAYVRIYRSTIEGELGLLLKDRAEGASFVDKTALASGGIYYYTLTAIDKNGNESIKSVRRSTLGNPNPFSPAF